MPSTLPTESELLVQFSRRSLWVALVLLLVLGGYAIVINVFPNSDAAALATRLFAMLPIGIAIALAAMRSSLRGAQIDRGGAAMKAVLSDEWRQHSLNRAYRNGLVAVMLAQPALAVLLAWMPLPHPLVLMASATALLGAGAVLSSMLVYDR
ncbi:MAG TPA: hypothetical protein VFG03_09580 [Telluria sp.]|nr:hypothetical protein [Telluria sp.]